MNRYTVKVTARMSGSVEVEAETEEDAINLAEGMEPDEWDDSCVDHVEHTDDPDLLSELCDECNEDIDDCECDEDEEDEDDDTDDE